MLTSMQMSNQYLQLKFISAENLSSSFDWNVHVFLKYLYQNINVIYI